MKLFLQLSSRINNRGEAEWERMLNMPREKFEAEDISQVGSG